MKKYTIYATAPADHFMGDVSAVSASAAADIAAERYNAGGLCHQCAGTWDLGDPEFCAISEDGTDATEPDVAAIARRDERKRIAKWLQGQRGGKKLAAMLQANAHKEPAA